MPFSRIGPWLITSDQTVMDMPPMLRRDFDRINADGLYRIDGLQHPLDLRPTLDTQQDVAAGMNERQRLMGFTCRHGTHNIDTRDNRSEAVGSPSDNGEDAIRCEADNAAAAIMRRSVC